jgi:hypothetical protein
MDDTDRDTIREVSREVCRDIIGAHTQTTDRLLHEMMDATKANDTRHTDALVKLTSRVGDIAESKAATELRFQAMHESIAFTHKELGKLEDDSRVNGARIEEVARELTSALSASNTKQITAMAAQKDELVKAVTALSTSVTTNSTRVGMALGIAAFVITVSMTMLGKAFTRIDAMQMSQDAAEGRSQTAILAVDRRMQVSLTKVFDRFDESLKSIAQILKERDTNGRHIPVQRSVDTTP